MRARLELYVVRHGKAGEREKFRKTGLDDSLRPLTATGKKEFRKTVLALSRTVPKLDAILSSPWKRAKQTARILAKAYAKVEIETSPLLIPSASHDDLIQRLKRLPRGARVAIVGHEPHLSALICYFLTGHSGRWVELRKGSIVNLSFARSVRAGGARVKL